MKLNIPFYPGEYKALLRLGIPITIGQVGMTVQGLSDTIMLGHHSTLELAAAGFVNNLFNLAILLCMGFSFGAVSQIGALYSQGRRRQIVGILKSSLVADSLQCLWVVAAMIALFVALPYLRQPAELLPFMQSYYLIILCSLPLVAVASGFKQFFDSINDTRTSMWIMLAGNVWNIIFNYLLIFGKGGMPELGIDGAAWATLSSRVLMIVLYGCIFFCTRRYAPYREQWRAVPCTWLQVRFLNRLGWPIAVQLGMETASFSLCAILLGWVGTSALAAHQIMINVGVLIFMFYVGIGSAVSIRVSNYNGLGNRLGIRHAAHAGYHMILAIGIVASSLVFIFRYHISAWFTDSPEVTAIVAVLAYPLVLYQLGDGVQTNYANALRGLGDVKKLMQYSFLAYVVISLPLSYLFGIAMGGGALGIWMGFPFGLSTAGLLYFLRFRKVSRMGERKDAADVINTPR